ncbi:MAG: DnaJ C-terminal domain-containing protein [Nitrospirota bacterium]
MAKRDYYEILGVSRDADDKQLKKAFRKFARKYHPDLNPNNKEAEQRFKEVNEAYEILSDPAKRKQYESFGHAAFDAGFQGSEGFRPRTGGFDPRAAQDRGFGSIFEDIFGDVFSGRRESQPVSETGKDLVYNLEIDLKDAYHGTSTYVNIQRGARLKSEQIMVKIPPGVDNGTKVRVAGKGGAGIRGGRNGDLYIITSIRTDRFYERKGDDLYCEVHITISEAALGAKIEVPTMDGTASMTIPSVTQGGQLFRLKEKGMPHLKGGGSGNQYVKVIITIPKNLTEEDKELFKKISALYTENPREGILSRK